MKRFVTCFAALGLALALSTTSRAGINLIANGSFEDGTNPGSFTTVSATSNSNYISDWKVTGGSVDYIGSYWQASDGVRSIDLSGNSDGELTISQTITTVANQKYYLTFDMAGNTDGGPTNKTLTVTLGTPPTSAPFAFSTVGHSKTSMGWTQKGFYFTADSTATTLSFLSTTGTAYGPAIDNVSLVSVPEPASLAMSGTALLGVTGLVLRRRKARVQA